ncbi:MAG: hypothetical protein GY822_01110 [Deltaproteobacteria bacterium]|nr:hypothetical protein [Deltaproteobacteria bacterium]
MLWLTISVFLSSVLGSNPAESLQVFRDVFFKILLLFFLLQNMLTSKERLVSFAVVQSVLCAALGLYAVVSKVSGNANIEGSRAALVGLLGDPNDLALILLMPIHFLFFFAKDGSGLRRVLAGIGFSLCILGVMSTLSRGGMLGLAGGMALSLRSFIKSKLVIAGLLFAGLLIFVIGSGVSDRRSGAIGGDEIDESAQGRLDAWKAGGRMLVRHPVLGVGLQRFADNFDRFSNNPVFWGRHETHNSYIKVAAETGFMGLIPFAALILRSLLQARRLNRRTPSSEKSEGESAIRKSSFSNIAGFCVAAFFLSQCWGWFFFIFFVYIDRCESILSSTPNLPGAKGNRQMAGGRCGIS